MLPGRLKKIKISSVSSEEDLMTLGRIYAQVGDNASAVLDREHLSTSKLCATRLKQVIAELNTRGRTVTEDDFYTIPNPTPNTCDLSLMSIGDLYNFFWHHSLLSGKLLSTIQKRIVEELCSRKPSAPGDQLKVDYCNLILNSEKELIEL